MECIRRNCEFTIYDKVPELKLCRKHFERAFK